MAGITQVLLPLVAVALAEAQFNIPGLPHPPRQISDGPRDSRITHNNVGYNSGYNTWFQHFGNPDAHQFSSESHEDFDPFFYRDPYFQGNWDHMPGINNVFNIPNPGYISHRHQSPNRGNNAQEKPEQVHNGGANIQKPEEKPKEIIPADKKTTEQDKGPKFNEANVPDEQNTLNEAKISDVENNLNEANISDAKNKLNEAKIHEGDSLPPKTNAIKKEDEKGDKDDKKVGLDKNKDFLLVGQGNNGNNVYLLHENNPNPTTAITPNANQPGNNIIYVPYNPGQSNNQVYQVVNGQPAPSNIQMTPDKLGVSNGYNNAVLNPGQSNMNFNAGSQNSGYVTIYSNGQLIQIPGVVVNSAPNNEPLQNVNQGQGTNYIIANGVPNNVQTVPAIQNPDSNIIYAAIPNQPSNGPVYLQVPNCMNAMSNGCGSVSNNGLPSNVVVYQANPNTVAQPAVYSNGVSNGYVQPNMLTNQGQGIITVAIPNNQNIQYQSAVQMPVRSGSNGYSQPIVLNLRQGQNVPNQGGTINNQNIPTVQIPVDSGSNGYNQPIISSQGQVQKLPNQEEKQDVSYQGPMMNNNQPTFQPTVQMPVNSGTNGYNQPILSNQPQGPNAPIQGATVNNRNTPLQPAVVIPISSGYGHPLITNPIVNVETRGDMSSNQNEASQALVPASGDSNNQGANDIVTPSNTEVINQESDITQPLKTSSIVLDSNNLSSLGAQPAIMISDFKDKSGGKKDKNKSKDKKEKKDKKKKKDKKSKDDDISKDSEPFTNKKDNLEGLTP